MVNVEQILKEFDAVKARRTSWEKMWELVARYIFLRKQGFTSDSNPGEFLTHGDVYDTTAPLAHGQMTSSLVGSLWKNGARTFRIVKPKSVKETTAIKEYYKEVNRRNISQMEHQRAGFGVAFNEYMGEVGAFGTSGIGVFKAKDGADHRLEYRAMGLKHMWICEDANGRVYKLFYETELDAFQLQQEYGSVATSIDSVKAALDAYNYATKFKVLWVIRPRESYDPSGPQNNQNMPIESIHIFEQDKLLLKESGFTSFPVKVARFYKNEGEEYGRGAGTECLPLVIDLNAFKEMVSNGAEQLLDPALYLLDDGSFGGGILDRSPHALTVLDITSRISNVPPIGQIGQVGDMNPVLKMIELLTQQVVKHFFVDRLLDLNNQTRMTLGEAQIRNEMRSDSLGGIFTRQMDEALTPTIERGIEIQIEAGDFGVIKGSDQERMILAAGKKPLYLPEELIKAQEEGEQIYNIEYVSPAMRILRSEELRGLMSTYQFAGAYGQAIPEFLVMLDKKTSMRMAADLTGASSDIFLSDDDYEKAWDQFVQSQQQEMAMRMEEVKANIAAKQGSAAQQQAQAQATQAGAGGGGAPANGMGAGMLI